MNPYSALAERYQFFVGRVIAQPGHNPVGKVKRVDENGAWLEDDNNARISVDGLTSYVVVQDLNSERDREQRAA